MARLPPLRPKEIARILEKIGFVFVRQRGSHRIYVRGSVGVTVPDHGRELKRGTLANIIRYTGLSAVEFIKLIK